MVCDICFVFQSALHSIPITYFSLPTGTNMTGNANEARRASLMGIACALAWGVTVFIGLNGGRNVWAQVINEGEVFYLH